MVLHQNPSQSYGVSSATWDHVYSVTYHSTQVNAPCLNPAGLVLDSPTPEGQKAKLTLGLGYIPRWFTCLHVPSSTSKYRSKYLIVSDPIMSQMHECVIVSLPHAALHSTDGPVEGSMYLSMEFHLSRRSTSTVCDESCHNQPNTCRSMISHRHSASQAGKQICMNALII